MCTKCPSKVIILSKAFLTSPSTFSAADYCYLLSLYCRYFELLSFIVHVLSVLWITVIYCLCTVSTLNYFHLLSCTVIAVNYCHLLSVHWRSCDLLSFTVRVLSVLQINVIYINERHIKPYSINKYYIQCYMHFKWI
jgi:hypothetical protein